MLNIIYSQTIKDSSEYILGLLKNRDKNLRHVVFTPDRANLIYQREIFDFVDEQCLFDVDVTTISRFASHFNNRKVLTKQGGIAIIKKILLENKKQLKIFSKSVDYNGFALSLFESICMFKACRILPSQIDVNTKSNVLNDKLCDLKFVFEKYEEYLKNDYTDSFNVLNFCASQINSDYKDTIFYFVGFDDFTKQGLFLIEKMLGNAKDVFISTMYGKKEWCNNYTLFDSTFVSNLIDICKTNAFKYDMVFVKPLGDETHKLLKKNLFGFNLSKCRTSDKIGICEYQNIEQEVDGTIKYLRFLLQKDSLHYGDFSIVVPNLERYKPHLIKNFAKYNIPFYLDQTDNFADHVVCRYVSAIVNIVDDPEQIFTLLNIPFVSINQDVKDEYLNYVQKYGIMGNLLVEHSLLDSPYMTELRKYIEVSKKAKDVSEYISLLRDFVTNVAFVTINQFAQKCFDEGEVVQYKSLSQAIDVMTRVFDELEEVLCGYVCDHKTFSAIYQTFVENINLTLPPVIVDSVFVGDIEKSYLQKTKYTFVLGCNEGNVPNYSAELGLFSDKEIGLMPQSARLNPTIAQINRRKKAKVFEMLAGFGEYLLVSYVASNGKSKMFASALVEDIKTIFDIKIKDMSWIGCPYTDTDIEKLSVEFNNLSQSILDENFSTLLKEYDYMHGNVGYDEYLSTLNQLASGRVLDEYNYQNEIPSLTQTTFAENVRIGVSEIECFNMCPYKHFVEHCLKVRDKKSQTFDAIDNGQIIHEFLSKTVPILEKREYLKDEIVQLVEKTLIPILNKKDYLHLVQNPYNKATVKALKNECVRLVKGVVYQLNNSDFSPFAFEKSFSFGLGKIGVGGRNVTLVGVIDRMDKWGDYYTIVDYKTGMTTMSDFTDVKSGKKWQLVVYMYVQSENRLKPAGCFYLPIKNDFFTVDACPYQMQGVLNDNPDIIDAMDVNLKKPNVKSRIVPIETNDCGIKPNSFFKNMCLNDEQIVKLNNYVMSNLIKQIEKIFSGVVTPNPLGDKNDNACKFCKYLGLCGFNELYGNQTREVVSCKTIDELCGEVADE